MAEGSWSIFGQKLPEFGITEAIGGLLGAPKTSQGGSNISSIFGGQAAATPISQSDLSNYTFGTQPPLNVPTNGGQTLGATTSASFGGSGSGSPVNPNPAPADNFQIPNPANAIGSAWDNYINTLNSQLNNDFPTQQRQQEELARNSYNSGVSNLGIQKEAGLRDVTSQQATSLKDLASNVKNLFNAGNTYLGARGAGDSSAANQYSYAISNMGTKERANIMNQAQARINQISDIYNTEKNNLDMELNQTLTSISDWFTNAQAQLKQQLAQAGLNRAQDINAANQNLYNQALSLLQDRQNDIRNRRSQLESWAMNNSKSIQEAVANMQTISQLPEFQNINNGMPTVNSEGQMNLFGFGTGTREEDKNKLFRA